jgi:predicted aspartyl protease
MWKPFPKTATWIVISSTLVLGNVACSNGTPDTSSSPQASPVVKSPVTPSPIAQRPPKPVASPPEKQPPIQPDQNYEQAIDIGTGAVTITKSAVSRDDWTLAANQWQQAIKLLKAVPVKSANHSKAQQKLALYQNFLADAKEKSTPPPKTTALGDSSPQFFSIPILGRNGGTPIVEVFFNGTQKFEMLFDTGASGTLITESMAKALRLKPVGIRVVRVADGAAVALPFAFLNSLEVDGRLKRKLEIAIAPPAMPIGLLGQDFFDGYDITIKENVIEFRRR